MASPKQRYLPINNSVPTLNQPVITLSRNLLVCSNINLSYCFCLCVDDFGVKYFSKDDANHLIQTLNNKYECTIDWEGEFFAASNSNETTVRNLLMCHYQNMSKNPYNAYNMLLQNLRGILHNIIIQSTLAPRSYRIRHETR